MTSSKSLEAMSMRVIQLDSESTDGPWRWKLNLQGKKVSLVNSRSDKVMDFVRWGMDGAAPRVCNSDRILNRVEHFAAVIPGYEHHASWDQTLAHPDLDTIAEYKTYAPALAKAVMNQTAFISMMGKRLFDELRSRLSDADALEQMLTLGFRLENNLWKMR